MIYLRPLMYLFKGTFINLKTMTFILRSKKKKKKKIIKIKINKKTNIAIETLVFHFKMEI